MKLFQRTTTENQAHERTTKGLFLGSPEAEAETLHSSTIPLGKVFSDFLGVLPQLEREKFIILGRKGSGKTAIAEYLNAKASNDANIFCDFVRRADFARESVVQKGSDVDPAARASLLFEWLILVKFARLCVQNNAIVNESAMTHLDKFLTKNAGYVDLDKFEAREFIHGKEFDVDITHLKRFFTTRLKRSLQIKSQKATFYQLIPSLREAILSLMASDTNTVQENEFVLFFDDLDIGFTTTDEGAVSSLVSLLRIVKDYNVNEFGKRGIQAKIIVLLRDDIARVAVDHADTAKVFSSYGIWLTWYDTHDVQAGGEMKSLLRLFINRRIAYNYSQRDWSVSNDPWSDLIAPGSQSDWGSKSAFKFVLDHTFYRPRDLILIFQSITDRALEIPIQPDALKNLVVRYSHAVIDEIRNELSAILSPEDVTCILSSLGHFARQRHRFSANQLKAKLREMSVNLDFDSLLATLFDYSLVGNISSEGHVTFKHRQEKHQQFSIDQDQDLIIHTALIAHFTGKPWYSSI